MRTPLEFSWIDNPLMSRVKFDKIFVEIDSFHYTQKYILYPIEYIMENKPDGSKPLLKRLW